MHPVEDRGVHQRLVAGLAVFAAAGQAVEDLQRDALRGRIDSGSFLTTSTQTGLLPPRSPVSTFR